MLSIIRNFSLKNKQDWMLNSIETLFYVCVCVCVCVYTCMCVCSVASVMSDLLQPHGL